MIQKKKKHKKKFLINGFSIIELMISIAIIGLVISASLIAFQSMQKNMATTSNYTKVGQDADFVLRKMERELKQAGYYYPSELDPILIQSDLISIDPITPQREDDSSTNTLAVEDARYFPEDSGSLVIINTGALDSDLEIVDYTDRNGNIFTGLVVLNPHQIGSNVYELDSLDQFISIIFEPEFPEEPIITTITVCFDEAQDTRVLISYEYNRVEETLSRLRQPNPDSDCQLDDPAQYEPVLINITDFIIDESRTYGGRIGVEIELRASEGSRQSFQTAISLPTS